MLSFFQLGVTVQGFEAEHLSSKSDGFIFKARRWLGVQLSEVLAFDLCFLPCLSQGAQFKEHNLEVENSGTLTS